MPSKKLLTRCARCGRLLKAWQPACPLCETALLCETFWWAVCMVAMIAVIVGAL